MVAEERIENQKCVFPSSSHTLVFSTLVIKQYNKGAKPALGRVILAIKQANQIPARFNGLWPSFERHA